ncbi:MAG: fuculose phosphate aldolase [Friedmanniella sp.]|nr:fuculose phosphate aldolase [Friedmanniella sp.]
MLYASERRAVVAACQHLSRERLVVGTAGNVSIRLGEHVVISPSGVDYEQLGPGDVGVHDLTGAVVEAELAPSSELPLHLAVYAASEHTAIVHTHSVASTALSVVVDEVPLSHYYSALFGGAVRVAPYATFGSDDLAGHVVAALADRTAALMENHGAVLVGSDLGKVLDRVAYLEYVCEVQLRILATGRPAKLLSEAEIERVRVGLSGYGQVSRG